MLSNETIIFLFLLTIIIWILSKFIHGKLFDFFSNKKTGNFNLWSAFQFALLLDFVLGIIGLFIGRLL